MTQNDNTNNKVNKKYLRAGSYSIIMTAVVIAVVVVINLVLAGLPTTLTKYDMSSLDLYTISEETEAVLNNLTTDVTIYQIAQKGSEDETISNLLSRYEALSSHVKVKTVDPGTNPTFIQNYTDENLSPNSLIVVSDMRSYAVDYYKIFTTQYSDEELYYYYYYGQMPTGTQYFNGELEITSAVSYVSKADLPVMYSLTGHGETEINKTIATYIETENIATDTLALYTVDRIPTDCKSIFINNPQADISASEAEMIIDYIQRGGSVILVTDFQYYSKAQMPNLSLVAAYVGLESVDGIIMEGDRNSYYGYQYTILPTKGSTATGPLALLGTTNKYTMLNAAHGIVKNSEGNGTVIPMLSTSSQAYIKAGVDKNITTLEKEEGDYSGSVYVAAAVYGEGDGTYGDTFKFVWYSSSSIVDESIDSYYVSGGNSDVFMASVNWMNENAVSVSVLGKALQIESLILTEAQSSTWAVVVTIIIPLAFAAGGFVIWLRRRKK